MEPQRGGKVPEAARDPERIELNKQDAVGLNDEENEIIDENNFNAGFFKSPFADDDYASDFPYNPVFDPIKISGSGGENYAIVEEPKYSNPYAVMYDSLFNKPEKKPSKPRKKISKDTYKYIDIDPSPPKTAYNSYELPPSTYQEPYQQPYEEPYKDPYQDTYQEPYQKPYQEPYQEPYQPYIEPPSYDYSPGYDYSPPANDAYAPPAPTYEPEPYLAPKPVGPVLLEKRPYEVKSVQPLPITVAETYTSFDCRNKHPGRHYADPEAQCQVTQTLLLKYNNVLGIIRFITTAITTGSKIHSSVATEHFSMNILVPVITRAMLSAKLETDTSLVPIIREDTRLSLHIPLLSHLITGLNLITPLSSLIMSQMVVSSQIQDPRMLNRSQISVLFK